MEARPLISVLQEEPLHAETLYTKPGCTRVGAEPTTKRRHHQGGAPPHQSRRGTDADGHEDAADSGGGRTVWERGGFPHSVNNQAEHDPIPISLPRSCTVY